ncbi:serine/threonine-protein kinase [Fimbriiglobus ruber]|uniref:serine/threonine-protein kinase n=1 Tax=Fimbriiglobus ruber TaxID=1908690 RepID=UPI00137AE44E|nr:serine/threonine-protein kinase [Fimbriiglobus ruber]
MPSPPTPPEPKGPTSKTEVLMADEILQNLEGFPAARTNHRTVHTSEEKGDPLVVRANVEVLNYQRGAADRYELRGEIARGGMGVVLRARDTVLGRDVAIKILYSTDARTEARFVQEAQITGQLQHPGTIPVYDLGRFPDGRAFLAMKLVRGKTLDRLLGERPAVGHEIHHWIQVFEQVCQTVAYAHSRGVIHRDLKPQNVIVSAFGQVRVLDWGLAKILSDPDTPTVEVPSDTLDIDTSPIAPIAENITHHGTALGTPGFMAPEQIQGGPRRVDERADVFGLGAILCVILTGEPPFADASQSVILQRNREGDVTDALARLDECRADAELVALAKRCLAPDPVARPRDARELMFAVTNYRAAQL